MRYYRTTGDAVVCEREDGCYDVSDATPTEGLRGLLAAAATTGDSLDELADRLVESGRAPPVAFDPATDATLPVRPDEVWGAGVTYPISQESREEVGRIGRTYLDAYEADRPELYFKATPTRTVGPAEAVGVRADSAWDVPEPELSVVLYEGEVVGYTVGNDVCSREIERQNLLYLPQSKTYRDCCAIGPCVATPATVGDPHDLDVSMRIRRDGETVFEGATSTAEMVRTVDELVDHLTRCNFVPEVAVLLTGTSIIPPDDVTLRPGDEVRIEVEGVGVLSNPVAEVA
jgi:2-dehydro-3-deoxy-D-arabinonate dehydratase